MEKPIKGNWRAVTAVVEVEHAPWRYAPPRLEGSNVTQSSEKMLR
jgi:hypothetical protein